MIEFYKGNRHDVNHFLKVWAMAKTIGELEGLDRHTQEVLELAAVIHDIACPLCREKYGDTDGKHQELESPALVEAFFTELPAARLTWTAFRGWPRTTIPIRTSAASTTRSCWRQTISSTRTSRAIHAPPSRISAGACSAPPRALTCWTAFICRAEAAEPAVKIEIC